MQQNNIQAPIGSLARCFETNNQNAPPVGVFLINEFYRAPPPPCFKVLAITPMVGENRQLVTNEPVEFEK